MGVLRGVEISVDSGPWTLGNLTVEVEQIEVSSYASEPDLKWEYTDAAGHFHAYDEKSGLPTLRRTKRWYRCAICNKKVTPGQTSSAGYRKFAPGRMSWSVEAHTNAQAGTLLSVRVQTPDRLLFGVASLIGPTTHGDGAIPLATIAGMSALGAKARSPQMKVSAA